MSEVNTWWRRDDDSSDEVATKPDLWRPIAERVGGFDLDPASGAEPQPIADERYTKADDGLAQPWFGTVWLNPPFDDKLAWYRRLVKFYRQGDVDRAVAIAPVDTSAEWFQRWFSTGDVIGFLDGRDWYMHSKGSPSFQTMVSVWNPTDDLVAWLETMGTVVEPHRDDEQTTADEWL